MAWFKKADSAPVPTQVSFDRFLQIFEYSVERLDDRPFARGTFNEYPLTFSMNHPTEAGYLLVHGIYPEDLSLSWEEGVAWCNTWNCDTMWGSAYLERNEEGVAGLFCDVSVPIRGGQTDEQLKTWSDLALSVIIECFDKFKEEHS